MTPFDPTKRPLDDPPSWSLHDDALPETAPLSTNDPLAAPLNTWNPMPTVLGASDTGSTPPPSFPASFPPYYPGPSPRAPGKLGRFCRTVLVLALGLVTGGLFLPGTPLHQAWARPAAHWLEANLGLRLPLLEDIEPKKEEAPGAEKEKGRRDILERELASFPGKLAESKKKASDLDIKWTEEKEARIQAERLRKEAESRAESLERARDKLVLEKMAALEESALANKKFLEVQERLDRIGEKRGPSWFKITSAIARGDPQDSTSPRASMRTYPIKVFQLPLKAGRTYDIRMFSGFDNFLRLENNAGKELEYNDDGGGDLNARIAFRPPATGIYRIICTSYRGDVGTFTLEVREE